MAKKLDVQKIQDRKIIPALIFVIIFHIFGLIFINFVKIPMEPNKPPPDIYIKFNAEVKKIERKRKPKEKQKKQEQKKEDVEIEQPITPEELEVEIDQDELKDFTEDFQQPLVPDNFDIEPPTEEELNLDQVAIDPGDYGEIDNLANVDMEAMFAGGIDRGGSGEAGFNPDLKEAQTGRRRNPNIDPSLFKRKTQKRPSRAKTGIPKYNLEDYIEPIILWMEKHPYPFSNILKIQMNYAPGDLTSRAIVEYEGIRYVMYLLCKKEIKQLGILFADFEAERYAIIKDAGLIKQAGYLLSGRFMNEGDTITLFDGKRDMASSATAVRYNNILWKWFERVQ